MQYVSVVSHTPKESKVGKQVTSFPQWHQTSHQPKVQRHGPEIDYND